MLANSSWDLIRCLKGQINRHRNTNKQTNKQKKQLRVSVTVHTDLTKTGGTRQSLVKAPASCYEAQVGNCLTTFRDSPS